MQLELNPTRFFRTHILCIATLTAAYVATQMLQSCGHQRLLGLVALFDLNAEHNVPSFFSAIALLFAGGLMFLAGEASVRQGIALSRYWQALAMIFIFLAIDEECSIHETIGQTLRVGYNSSSAAWHYSWVFLYLPFVLAIGLAYLPFLRRLPAATRNALVLAGCLFVGGAAGLEIVAGFIAQRFGDSWWYRIEVIAEENCEMLGVAILIRGVLAYVTQLQCGLAMAHGEHTASTDEKRDHPGTRTASASPPLRSRY